jgi:hypothetical protein
VEQESLEQRDGPPTPAAAPVASRRLGALTRAQLQGALDRFGLGRLVGAEPVASGNWGQNCFVTSTAGAFVLRGAPFYPGQLPEEGFFARLLRERTGAPAPWPYLVAPDDGLFGWPYALMGRLPGEQLAGLVARGAVAPGDRLRLAGQLGAVLAEVQELTWPVAGTFDPASGGIRPCAAFNPGLESLAGYGLPPDLDAPAYVREFLARARRAAPERTTAADEAWAEAVIARAADALREPFTPRCVLPDHQETNVAAVRDAGGGWRLSGVFDLMGAAFGDGEKALCRQLRGYLAEDQALAVAYARAYFERRPPRPGVRQRLALYLLADALTIWEWAHRAGRTGRTGRTGRMGAAPALTLREWLGGDDRLAGALAQALPAGT